MAIISSTIDSLIMLGVTVGEAKLPDHIDYSIILLFRQYSAPTQPKASAASRMKPYVDAEDAQ